MSSENAQSWLAAFKSLLDDHLPNHSPLTLQSLLLCGLVVTFGLLLVFASVRLARPLVTAVGFGLGASLGMAYAAELSVSQPLDGAIGGVIVSWIAFRTYRLWLTL